ERLGTGSNPYRWRCSELCVWRRDDRVPGERGCHPFRGEPVGSRGCGDQTAQRVAEARGSRAQERGAAKAIAMRLFRRLSIPRKLTVLTVSTSTAALLLASVVLAVHEWFWF